MSLTRLYNDEKVYTRFVKESEGPGNYRLERDKSSDNAGYDKTQCYVDKKNIRLQKSGVGINKSKSIVDIDSDLRNLTRKLSNDPDKKFKPIYDSNDERVNNTRPGDTNSFKLPENCDFKTNSYTRLDNPSSNLRGTGINRWDWLCRNPQSNVFIPFKHSLNTRLIMKDMYSGGSSAKTDICDME